MNTIEQIIKNLELSPHPEGGYYKEVYRSQGIIERGSLGENFDGKRNYTTSIYFLLTSDTFSAFHRIKQDEIWHFYDGSTIELHTIANNGVHNKHLIGSDFENGEVPQSVVPKDHWFAASVLGKNAFALVGCTVSPGFDFKDFELATRDDLTKRFPEHSELITRYTRI